jgi:hypothetical protein
MASERTRNLYDHKSSKRNMGEPHQRERGGGDASMSHQGSRREAARTAGRGPTLDRGPTHSPHSREARYGGMPGEHLHEIHARHERERHEMRHRHAQEREHAHHQQTLEHENMGARHEDEHENIRHRHELESRQDQSGEGGAGMEPRGFRH